MRRAASETGGVRAFFARYQSFFTPRGSATAPCAKGSSLTTEDSPTQFDASPGSGLAPNAASRLAMFPNVEVLGAYHLLRPIGVGGMARVWLAVDSRTGEKVAVKRMLPEITTDPELRNSFIDEARLGLRFSHPNIVDNIELGEVTTPNGTEPYLVLELLQGRTLLEVLRAARRRRLVMPLGVVIRAVVDAARALSYAHKLTGADGKPLGVVHRDVSPHNLFVCADGRVKLVDFGIAKARSQSHQTRTGVLKGKLAYLAPEQIRGLPADARVDVFALGIVLHEALVGVPLFRGENDAETLHKVLSLDVPPPEKVRASVPSGLGAIALRALHRAPDRRLPSAEAFADALEAVAESEGIDASAEEVRAFSTELYPEDADAQEKDAALVRRTYEHLTSGQLRALGSDPWITPPRGIGGSGAAARTSLMRIVALVAGALAIMGSAALVTSTALRSSWRTHSKPAMSAPTAVIAAAPVVADHELATPVAAVPAKVPEPSHESASRAASDAVKAAHAPIAPKPVHLGTGRLRLAANPWAEVSIDGKPVGTTPLRTSDITEGNHVVTLSNRDLHLTVKKHVHVHAGKESVLVVDLFAEARRPK